MRSSSCRSCSVAILLVTLVITSAPWLPARALAAPMTSPDSRIRAGSADAGVLGAAAVPIADTPSGRRALSDSPVVPETMVSTGAVLTLSGAAARFGSTVAVAGDVNGDGYSDLLVGAPGYSNGESSEGEALLFFGGPSGYSGTAAWAFESDIAGAYLGWSVAPAGDVDGDGYDDVIVGAPGLSSNALAQNGRAYVFLGGPSGLAPSPAWTFDGDQGGQLLGWSVCTAGDIDGDGYADVVLGSPGYYNIAAPEEHARIATMLPSSILVAFTFNNGRAQAFLGGPSGLAASPQWDRPGFQFGGGFGYSVSTAHDVDGDGYDDVIIGMPFGANVYTSAAEAGEFDVYDGGPGGLSFAPSAVGYGQGLNEMRGFSVAGVGDIDGDGFADVVVGAPGYTDGVSNQGAIVGYRGTSVGLNLDWDFLDEGPLVLDNPGGQFGFSVAPAGDVNGDGFADFVAGAPTYTTGPAGIDVGYVAIYEGTPVNGGTPGTAYARLAFSTTGSAGGEAGHSACTAGDEDGDGFADVAVGAPGFSLDDGQVVLLRGAADAPAPAPISSVILPPNVTQGQAVNVSGAGDLDGDGFDDLSVDAAPGQLDLYAGGPGPLASLPAWSIAASSLGATVTNTETGKGAGDVNGDGSDDLIVLAQDSNVGACAFLVAGGPSGPVLPPLWGRYGVLYQAGDVNGDGYSDVIWYNGALPDTLEVLAGGPAGLGPTPLSTFVFGSSVWPTNFPHGDWNGDGFGDVIFNDFTTHHAMLYLGSPTGLGTTPARTYAGVGQFAGDLNGDGLTDLCNTSGTATIVYGNDALPAQTLSILNADLFGDFNGDGFEDVGTETGAGTVTLFLGSATGVSSSPWTSFQIPTYPWETFSTFAGLGMPPLDLNGDGLADIVYGERSDTTGFVQDTVRVQVHYGDSMMTGAPGLDRAPQQRRFSDAAPVGLLGLSDSQSQFRLAACGRSPAGRARVRMETDVQSWGVAFETNLGSLARDPWAATGAPGPHGSFVPLDAARALPLAGPTDKWRMRLATHSPYFPGGPWLTPVGNGRNEYDLRNASAITSVPAAGGFPGGLRLAAPIPNPASGETRVDFALPEQARLDLAIFDLAGRRIATLASGVVAAGPHEVRWDGRDASGQALDAGIYFARLACGDRQLTQKIVEMR